MAKVPELTQAAVYERPGVLRVEPRPVPAPADDDVLIAVSHCGVCGTDLHMVLEGWGRPESVGGHELSGTVAAVGAAVDEWSEGDRVVVDPRWVCGECAPCRAGQPSWCRAAEMLDSSWDGAFSGYVVVDHSQVHAVPDGLSLRAAALTEPLAVALHGITRSGVRRGDRVLVTGAGPIGLLAIAALRARFDDLEIVVSEPREPRRERAGDAGADQAIEPADLTAPDLPMQLVESPFDVVLECSGNARALEIGLAQLRPGGTLVIVGAGLEAPAFDPNRVLLNELTVTGAFNYDADGFPSALGLLASGALPLDALVEPDDVSLDGLLDAMTLLADGTTTRKVLVAP